MNKISETAKKFIYVFYIALFFLTPLIFYPFSKYFPFPWVIFDVDPLTYELFEFNKMFFVYGITILVATAWLVRCIDDKRVIFKKTFLDYPLVLFLISQVLSTIFSIDTHTSIWGYYSRFHGGLVSSICYVILYWGIVSNLFERKYLHKMLIASAVSGSLVAWYGIAQHFGIDAHFWRQNVRARIFSTLGQPNWLAAYVVGLMPVLLGYGLYGLKKKMSFVYLTAFWLLFFSLIFSYSRSGFLAAILSIVLFFSLLVAAYRTQKLGKSIIAVLGPLLTFLGLSGVYVYFFYKASAFAIPVGYVFILGSFLSVFYFARNYFKRWFLTILTSFLAAYLITVATGIVVVNMTECEVTASVSCIEQGSKSLIDVPTQTFGELFSAQSFRLNPSANLGGVVNQAVAAEAGGTETGNIRFIVWKGAWEIFKNYPVLGSGVESFAYSFYQYRPLELLKTTEWDFLYNKAHNEYVNILATTGIFGLAVYLILLGSVAWIFYDGYRATRRSVGMDQGAEDVLIMAGSKNQKGKKNVLNKDYVFDDRYNVYMLCGLVSGFVTILITNFFGFSVVNVGVFFFLYPALIAILSEPKRYSLELSRRVENIWKNLSFVKSGNLEKYQFLQFTIVGVVSLVFLIKLMQFWFADIAFAEGRSFNSDGLVGRANSSFRRAVGLRDDEPFYYSELGWTQSNMVYALMKNNDASTAATLAPQAEENSTMAVTISPENVLYWKKRADVFYNLSYFDESAYRDNLIKAIERTLTLSPTDVSTFLTLSVYYERLGEYQKALDLLNKATEWKPDLAKAWYRKGEITYDIYKTSKNEDDKKRANEYQLKAIELSPESEEFKQQYD
jgi:tetratricopeptide (TPR) repeat protein